MKIGIWVNFGVVNVEIFEFFNELVQCFFINIFEQLLIEVGGYGISYFVIVYKMFYLIRCFDVYVCIVL